MTMEVFKGLMIPFLGTTLGSACVFVMKDKMNELVQRALTGFAAGLFTPDKLEFNKDANMLKGGLVYADYITTVSDSYAQEIQTDYYGEGLNGLLSARHMDMQGIVNGIDINAWNPQTDNKIAVNYNLNNVHKKKVLNKLALQKKLGLKEDKDALLIGMVSRLTFQKGA